MYCKNCKGTGLTSDFFSMECRCPNCAAIISVQIPKKQFPLKRVFKKNKTKTENLIQNITIPCPHCQIHSISGSKEEILLDVHLPICPACEGTGII